MRCSHCGKCCEETEMLLSEADARRLEQNGYRRRYFTSVDRQGFCRLKNSNGYCVFYDRAKQRCKVYRYRPQGCRVYPVIYSQEDGVIVDDLCPMKDSVSRVELRQKGKRVLRLLERIDEEAQKRAFSHERLKQS
jgi:Fe-S-cluster containining protein